MTSSPPPETESADSTADWLRLTLIPGVGGESQRKLLRAFGSPENVFSASRAELRRAVGEKTVALLLETDTAARVGAALDWAKAPERGFLTLADPLYPQALLNTPDPPTLLYVLGNPELLNRRAIAIVGSRHPTPQGERNAEDFAAALADAGLLVVSGMALGIDAASHRGALRSSGETVAFIGTGIDRVYPARNKDLAVAIAATGAVVSEFPLGTPVTASNFPRRNRLISGLAAGVLVVEATTESGSLITARLAGEQGREVFAIPGSIHSPQSRGCHRLIRQGAKLVETARDVLEELGDFSLSSASSPATPSSRRATEKPLPSPLAALLELMGFDPCGLDELLVRARLPMESISPMLLQLELEGHVASLPGGRYQRLAPEYTAS
ncbi:MAG: DNA-processing protein DprA [Candidatus Accumulibacter sp.]|jgi:DNA processing protein|nr:DNA-processing protein DprA [Accumulibacter sp.]